MDSNKDAQINVKVRPARSEMAQRRHDVSVKGAGQEIAQGNQPMNTDLPVAMQLYTHGGQESVPPCTGQLLRVNHQTRNSRLADLIVRSDGGRRRLAKVDTLLFEPKFQQGSDQQGIEVNAGALLRVTQQMQAIQRAFEKSKDQFHLPAISIQQNDLKSGQVQSVGENQVEFLPHLKRNQAIDDSTEKTRILPQRRKGRQEI